MCEIALCVSGPGISAPMRYQDGDIIDVLPDGWKWSALELSNPNWRILKFPGVDLTVFQDYLQIQPPPQGQAGQPGVQVWRRAQSFNYGSLSQAPSVAPNAITAGKINPYIADSTRASATLAVPLAAADVPSLATVKAAIVQNNVIGNAPTNVIG